MNSEFDRIWKQAIVAYSRYYPGIYMEVLRKTMLSLIQNRRYSGRDVKRKPLEYMSVCLSIYLSDCLSVCLSIYLWLYSPCGTWPLLQFLSLYIVGRTPWTGDRPVARPLPAHTTTHIQNKRTQTSMPRMGLEPRTPMFELAKTIHA
jgi:hypothetical protein